MFETRRPATSAELARLYESWGIPSMNDQLAAAEVSEIATLAELGAQHTVIAVPNAVPGTDGVYTVVELHASWSAGGGHPERDQRSYQHHMKDAVDSAYAPVVLFEPTRGTSSGWRIVDGTHRAVALYTVRDRTGTMSLRLPVFVLAEQLR